MAKTTLSSKLLILLLIILFVNTADIQDFEYSQYIQLAKADHKNHINLDFKPIEITQDMLRFPQACQLIDLLERPVKAELAQTKTLDIDDYLNDLKQKFLELLTLTHSLKSSEQKIKHFEQLINKTSAKSPDLQQIQQLQAHEVQLKRLSQKITQLQKNLSSQISQLSSPSQLSLTQQAHLHYRIQSLRQKLSQLTQLKKNTHHSPSPNYQYFFNELQTQFNNQSKFIENIDLIVRKKGQLTKLNYQKINMESSIMALQLYIKDVEICHKEKERIRHQLKNHQKIKELTNQLRLLKKNQEPNSYCQGVVKKLTQKIKTMFRLYDIFVSCASDLSQTMNSLRKDKQQLQQINTKIAELQALDNLQDFEQSYSNQKREIEMLFSKSHSWKLQQFQQSPQKLSILINITQSQLTVLLQQQSNIHPSQARPSVNHLVNELKQLKKQYCQQYGIYQRQANQVWIKTYQYQSEIRLKNQLLNYYNQQKKTYQLNYNRLIQIRAQIYDKLNYYQQS